MIMSYKGPFVIRFKLHKHAMPIYVRRWRIRPVGVGNGRHCRRPKANGGFIWRDKYDHVTERSSCHTGPRSCHEWPMT